mgnify:CR=1 FL=1
MSTDTIEVPVQITEQQRATLVGESGDIRSRIEALIQEAVEQHELEQEIEALLPEVISSIERASASVDHAVAFCDASNKRIEEMELKHSQRRSRGAT